jgi:flavodoxin
MRSLIICHSVHHGNTLKVAHVLAEELDAVIRKPSELADKDLDKYDLIGFGAGIYDDAHHVALLDCVDRLPKCKGRKAFIFSTSGVPVSILGNKFLKSYSVKAHRYLREKLESKGYKILGELILPGFNTNVFLKYIGGLNKNRPNEEDFSEAREFAVSVLKPKG